MFSFGVITGVTSTRLPHNYKCTMNLQWILYACLLLFSADTVETEQEWELKKDQSGIKVYYRDSEHSAIKELRIVTEMNASLSAIMSLLYDVKSYTKWVYSCSESYVAKQVDDKEIYYYSKMDFPWPLSDRDVIAHSSMEQNKKTGKVISSSKAAPDFMPRKEDIVRLQTMEVRWELTPKKDGTVHVEYYLYSDPGGNIPDWVVNLGLDRGPVQSLLSFKELLRQDKYQKARLAFIKDFGTGR